MSTTITFSSWLEFMEKHGGPENMTRLLDNSVLFGDGAMAKFEGAEGPNDEQREPPTNLDALRNLRYWYCRRKAELCLAQYRYLRDGAVLQKLDPDGEWHKTLTDLLAQITALNEEAQKIADLDPRWKAVEAQQRSTREYEARMDEAKHKIHAKLQNLPNL